jgi:quercetin dioxygenase-like cupin family protein
MRQRFIPFSSLRYCTDAFIDYRIPGCAPKYNYALIGPGVSQNPNQPVNLREPHGFQVGGVSMPPGVTNPPHMHFTCEVFLCTRGQWELHWGFNPEKLTADLDVGDICSVPTWIYRGFRNAGTEDGFMFTALGGNDTGGILWGPTTLEAAAREGVHLTDRYEIVDEQRGQAFSKDMRRLEPMTPDEVKALRHWSREDMQQRIVRFADIAWSPQALLDSVLDRCGALLGPVIGLGMTQDRNHLAPIANAHGFSLEWLKIPAGGQVSTHRLAETQVVIVKKGEIELSVQSGEGPVTQTLQGSTQAWDSFSIPGDCWRTLRNTGAADAFAVVITEGDHRKRIEWHEDVIESAGRADRAIDANGFVAPKRFIDRSQR